MLFKLETREQSARRFKGTYTTKAVDVAFREADRLNVAVPGLTFAPAAAENHDGRTEIVIEVHRAGGGLIGYVGE